MDKLVTNGDVDGLVGLMGHLLSQEGRHNVLESLPRKITGLWGDADDEHKSEGWLLHNWLNIREEEEVTLALSHEKLQSFTTRALELLAERRSSYARLDVELRHVLARVLFDNAEYVESAKVLTVAVSTATDSGGFTDQEITEMCVRVAQGFLSEGMTSQAGTFVNKAQGPSHGATEEHTKVRFKVVKAQVLDAQKEFYNAAHIYFQLSQPSPEITPEDNMAMLDRAVTCVLLAKSGARGRDLLMGSIYRDERVADIEHFKYVVFEAVFRDRLLRWDADGPLRRFEASLEDHQKADYGDGTTVLSRAINEHNMLAASRVYKNIRFSELGTLLGVDAESAEAIASKMVMEGRLQASIDQVDSMLHFDAGAEALSTWDEHIKHLCLEVNSVAMDAAKRFPALAP